MADITGGFAAFGGMTAIIKIVVWAFVALLVCLSIAAAVVFLVVHKQSKQIFEINLISKRLRIYRGKEKTTKSGIKNFFAKKIGRFIPIVQEEYKWLKKNKEVIPLIKDNNGLLHTLKLPNEEEVQRWYMIQYGIDLNDTNALNELKNRQKKYDEIHDIYALPNPHENLEWLGNQCIESDQEFKFQHWWQTPTFLMLGTLFICFITFVVTMIISKRV